MYGNLETSLLTTGDGHPSLNSGYRKRTGVTVDLLAILKQDVSDYTKFCVILLLLTFLTLDFVYRNRRSEQTLNWNVMGRGNGNV